MIIALLIFWAIVLILFVAVIVRNYNSQDPVKHCNVYKQFGCSHVDGYLCDFKDCDIRLNQELFDLGQELDIPIKDRLPHI